MARYPFERFLNVRSAGGASASRGGGRVSFLTDISGTAQLWTVDRPMGWPEQLTFYEDRLLFAAHSPTADRIAFGQDSGGNEEQVIHWIAASGGLAERLSPTQAKHLWGGWSKDGALMAWSHNGRNKRDFDVFVFDPATGAERLVLEGEGMWYVSTWLPGNRHLVVGRADSNANNDLYLLDLTSGEKRHLTPHRGDATFGSAVATPDGRSLYLVSNDDRDVSTLARIDLAGGGGLEWLEEATWDREDLTLDGSGRWLVVLVNEEGYTRVEVRDLSGGPTRVVDGLPRGTSGGARFIRGTSRFLLSAAAPSDSGDVWSVDAPTGQAVRWTRSSLAGLERDALVEPDLVHFPSFDGLRIPAFYYRPRHVPGPYPVMINIHGGPESQSTPAFGPTIQYLLQEGFAVLLPNVRGSTGYGKRYMQLDDVRKRMDSVADVRAARDWLVEHGGGAPKRIGLIGGSYGGFMVLSSMVTYPDLWAAGVDIVGIANFVTFLENTSPYRRHLREAEYGSLEKDRDYLVEISPLTHIHRIAAPLMVVHGRNDPRVPVGEAEQVVAAARERGLPVEVLIYDDEGHGLAKRPNRLDAYPRIARFLDRHLRGSTEA